MKRDIPFLGAVGVCAVLLCRLPAAQEVMQWESNFAPIDLDALTTRDDVATGSSTVRLLMNGDVELSADNSTTARLSGPGGDVLITEYKLTFDGDGTGATGAATVDYTPYDSFLNPPVLVTHVMADDDVNVTLHVRAQNPPGDVANAGTYTATATLTASWVGP